MYSSLLSLSFCRFDSRIRHAELKYDGYTTIPTNSPPLLHFSPLIPNMAVHTDSGSVRSYFLLKGSLFSVPQSPKCWLKGSLWELLGFSVSFKFSTSLCKAPWDNVHCYLLLYKQNYYPFTIMLMEGGWEKGLRKSTFYFIVVAKTCFKL